MFSKKLPALLILSIMLLGMVSCSGHGFWHRSPEPDPDAAYSHISMDEAREMIESGSPGEDYILLDTRTLNVYKHDHIPGAICIPEPDISSLGDDDVIEELPDKDQKIIVYCQFGSLSKIVADKLCDMGYTNVYEFDGMDYWEGEVEYGDDYE